MTTFHSMKKSCIVLGVTNNDVTVIQEAKFNLEKSSKGKSKMMQKTLANDAEDF